MNLYLFDLDETLVNVGHIHKKAYEEMMSKVYSHAGRFEDGKGPGRTSHNILYDMLAHMSKEEVDSRTQERSFSLRLPKATRLRFLQAAQSPSQA